MTHQHQVTCLEPFIMKGQMIDVVKNGLSTNTTSFIIGVNVLAISFHNTFGIFHIWSLTLMAVINVLDNQNVHLTDLLFQIVQIIFFFLIFGFTKFFDLGFGPFDTNLEDLQNGLIVTKSSSVLFRMLIRVLEKFDEFSVQFCTSVGKGSTDVPFTSFFV